METADQSSASRPNSVVTPAGFVTQVDYFLTLLSERNTRFDSEIRAIETLVNSLNSSLVTMVSSLKASTDERFHESELRHQQRFEATDLRNQQRFDEVDLRYEQRFGETDLRYQQRFDQQREALIEATVATEKAVGAALESAEKAVVKAETATEKRFDSVNEFRAQLRDQATTFIPRIEAEQRLTQLADRVEELRTSDALRTGRSNGGNSLYGWIVGGVGALATIIIVVVTLLK